MMKIGCGRGQIGSWNTKELYASLSTVDLNLFNLISNWNVGKVAWETLRAAYECIAIEEANGLTKMKIDNLCWNLTTHEMKLDALKASLKGEDEEAPQESISFLARNFDGTMRSFNQKPNWTSDSPRGNDRRFDSGKGKNESDIDEDSDADAGKSGDEANTTDAVFCSSY